MKQLDSLVDEVGKTYLSVILEKDGTPAAVLVSLEDYRTITSLRERLADQIEHVSTYAATQSSQDEIQAEIEAAVAAVEDEARLRLTRNQ
ncbi:MAG: type II toxin-antitoxin system Phd/YefM family antitoxin [Trueperaceae bacterium]|nr:MAG: type II toxin-antitoxin system Phd/YefM family antitoxin [Trueperaceae bacterium]